MTPHNSAKIGEIAKIVVLFGDPTQAHHLSHKYLSNVRKVSDIRYACFFTGEYKGKTYTFGTSGMGAASAAIYIYELYEFYKVEKIIRAGSCGSYAIHDLKDTVIVKEVFSDTTLWSDLFYDGANMEVLEPTQELHNKLVESSKKLNYNVPEVRCRSTDVFYNNPEVSSQIRERSKATVVEMEAYILFFHAKLLNKEAACLLSVVDKILPKGQGTVRLSIQEQIDVRCPSVEIILNADI